MASIVTALVLAFFAFAGAFGFAAVLGTGIAFVDRDFIAFITLGAFIAFVDPRRLGGATALAAFIAFIGMAMRLVRGLSMLQACAQA